MYRNVLQILHIMQKNLYVEYIRNLIFFDDIKVKLVVSRRQIEIMILDII